MALVVIFLDFFGSISDLSASTYTGNQQVSVINAGAHHWSFRLTTTIVYNYPGNEYITSASNATITNKVCLPPIPTGTSCKIEAAKLVRVLVELQQLIELQ